MRSVLISGSSIAGPTLAYWLARHGFVPTLVERAPAPRPGGQAIDIRGPALQVIAAMGLTQAVVDLRTHAKGVSTLDADGREVWRSDSISFSGGRLDSDDIEILRDDLAMLLLGTVPKGTELIYGDSIASLSDEPDGVLVAFEKAPARKFDLVVGADGLHSKVRDLAFGDEAQFLRPLGIALAVFSTPNFLGLSDWQLAYREGDTSYVIYTARKNAELRVSLGFAATFADERRGDLAGQMVMVAERCGHFRWEIPRLLNEMRSAPDFYLGVVAQTKMPGWTKGRIALVGDAGYCPSPFTGQGTSLAIVGAYLLAYELAQSPMDHGTAFARYDAKMRPYVEKNQALADVGREFPEGDAADWSILMELEKAKNAIVLEGL